MYKRYRVRIFGAPAISIMLIIFAIIFIIDSPQLMMVESIIMIGCAVLFMIIFFIFLTYYNHKIKELEADEILEEEEKRKKDERIRELEKTLEEAKKDS